MVQVDRWRFAGCATSFINANYQPQTVDNKRKLYIKFRGLATSDGYEAFLTDFDGHLWKESLIGTDLQERLKLEASGLEIESSDLLKLLEQMCQNIVESSCETSSDMTNLILKTSVKIGFIKLKWTFKSDLCGNREYNEMIRTDFLMPFFGNLREDKEIKNEIEDKELNAFYETVIPNLKQTPLKTAVVDDVLTFLSPVQNSFDSERTLTPPITGSPIPAPITVSTPVPEEITEEMKRKALEEQLQAAKKKKMKLI